CARRLGPYWYFDVW
nr:immunoglobulin heavy chain junction region [Mus musculus]